MKATKPEVLITKEFPEEVIRPLKNIANVTQWNRGKFELMPREEVLKVIGRMTAIINQAELKVDQELLEKGHQLKIIANVSIGFDNMNLDLMTKYGVWGSNTPGFFDYPVVEYAVGGMITIFRRLLEADQFVKNGDWGSFQPGRWDGDSLENKTLGIIGMGNIGQSLALLARCLGMKVVYFSRNRKDVEYPYLPLNELLELADVVSVHVPYSKNTHELISAPQFSIMKKGAIFVNTSRGKIVHEPDLIKFLQSGHLSGAILDVFAEEPRVPEALRTMSNVLLTPHIAGGTRDRRIACYKLAVKNILDVLNQKKPKNSLNKIKIKPRVK
ncbi:MAG: NAD(P)-dependent oxidoreductase [Cyclobacteriaceae bacterium]